MQFGNRCMRAMKWGAGRQLQALCGARGSKYKKVINRARGQNGKQSVSSAISLGYRDIVNFVTVFNAFTAIYAGKGICGISPATRLDTSDQQLCFTWCRLPRM
eukprot:3343839-Pleurochrysis_carterae.AAC.6